MGPKNAPKLSVPFLFLDGYFSKICNIHLYLVRDLDVASTSVQKMADSSGCIPYYVLIKLDLLYFPSRLYIVWSQISKLNLVISSSVFFFVLILSSGEALSLSSSSFIRMIKTIGIRFQSSCPHLTLVFVVLCCALNSQPTPRRFQYSYSQQSNCLPPAHAKYNRRLFRASTQSHEFLRIFYNVLNIFFDEVP